MGAGATLADVQRAASAAGLVFGVDLAARDSATVGGMASTNAGGLRTVRYGNMGEQVLGLDVALPDGSVVHRHSQVRRDNTGYDLASLFIGAEGTLGVITGLDLRLHPTPTHRVTAICGFDDLDALVETGRAFRDMDGIAALELIDARASALTAEHVGVAAPVDGAWQLLIELAGDTDQTERLADALEDARMSGEPAVGVDVGAQQRLWQVRESVAEVLGVYGPPLKFDVSLPLSAIDGFAAESAELVAKHAPDAIPVLFGHIGEGNLHLNVVRCGPEAERELYSAMMELIARLRRQRQLRARRRHPQARLRVDVAHRGRYRGDARGQGRLRPVRIPQPRSAFRLVAARRRVSAVARRVVGVVAGMPAVGLEPERPLLGVFLAQVVASSPSVACRCRLLGAAGGNGWNRCSSST